MTDPSPLIIAVTGLIGSGGVAGLVKVVRDAKAATDKGKTDIVQIAQKIAEDTMKDLRAELKDVRMEQEAQRRQLNLVITDRDALVAYVYRLVSWVDNGGRKPRPNVPQHLLSAFTAAGVPWPDQPKEDEK